MHRLEGVYVGALLLIYLALGALFAVRTPAWQAPDEPAHYNYVRQLVEGDLPVIEPGDWDQAYLEQIVGSRFDPAYPITGITYEDWQPPLYYLIQWPVFQLTGGSLTAMRLLSVLLGAGVVALAYVIGRAVFGGRIAPALGVAAFVAFLPQHLAILSSVNNDSLSELIIAAVLALLIVPWPDRPATGRLAALGLLLGAGFLTKGQAYLMAPVAGAFLLARYWQQWRPLARSVALVFVPALALGLLWWGRNAFVYGDLDVLARAAHDEVVVGQPRTVEWLAQYGLGGTVGRFIRTTFISFWGQFGWMAAPLPGWMVGALAVMTVGVGVGLVLATAGHRPTTDDGRQTTAGTHLIGPTTNDERRTTSDERNTRHSGGGRPSAGGRRLQLLVLILTFLLTLALHVAYNLTFVQHQGRYLYPALIPIAVGFVGGFDYWLQPLARRWPWAEWLLPLGLSALLIAMALFALWRILPGLAPG